MAPRIPRKKGQKANSKKHSDLYTDENPKGTIKNLGFAKVKDAVASVAKIKGSSKSHAHKTQAAIAMEQRARENCMQVLNQKLSVNLLSILLPTLMVG